MVARPRPGRLCYLYRLRWRLPHRQSRSRTWLSRSTRHARSPASISPWPGHRARLLGPNGAGKTTLVRILSTLLRPTPARLAVLGFDVLRDATRVRGAIGLAGQFAAVDDTQTGAREPQDGRPALRLTRASRQAARRRDARPARPHRCRRVASARLLRWHAPPARPGASLVGRPRSSSSTSPRPASTCEPRTTSGVHRPTRRIAARRCCSTTQYLEEADLLADHIVGDRPRPVIAERHAAELKPAGRRPAGSHDAPRLDATADGAGDRQRRARASTQATGGSRCPAPDGGRRHHARRAGASTERRSPSDLQSAPPVAGRRVSGPHRAPTDANAWKPPPTAVPRAQRPTIRSRRLARSSASIGASRTHAPARPSRRSSRHRS